MVRDSGALVFWCEKGFVLASGHPIQQDTVPDPHGGCP